jgi:hypothetical protein
MSDVEFPLHNFVHFFISLMIQAYVTVESYADQWILNWKGFGMKRPCYWTDGNHGRKKLCYNSRCPVWGLNAGLLELAGVLPTWPPLSSRGPVNLPCEDLRRFRQVSDHTCRAISCGLWTITILDIIHRPVSYLKHDVSCRCLKQRNVNKIYSFVPHWKHITSPLRAQQVNAIYMFVTMVY